MYKTKCENPLHIDEILHTLFKHGLLAKKSFCGNSTPLISFELYSLAHFSTMQFSTLLHYTVQHAFALYSLAHFCSIQFSTLLYQYIQFSIHLYYTVYHTFSLYSLTQKTKCWVYFAERQIANFTVGFVPLYLIDITLSWAHRLQRTIVGESLNFHEVMVLPIR